MHTIFSGLAAFYSDNLATEVIKGTKQKVLAGGTPMMARSATSTPRSSSTAWKAAP
jgi:hypothetical protein